MTNFTLEPIDWLPPNPVEVISKLVIDDYCPHDNFCETMEKAGNQAKSLEKIQTIITFIANGTKVPSKWFQELKHRNSEDNYPDYEVRAKQLRLYLFHDENEGKVIVLGELKKGGKTQSKAIAKMREIKLAYFASKNK